jgi:hypothetical protein
MPEIDIPSRNVEIIRRYLKALENGVVGDELAQFFDPVAIFFVMEPDGTIIAQKNYDCFYPF